MINTIKKEIQRQLRESEERLSHIKARGWVAPNEEQLIVHLKSLLSFIDTLEVINPYEQCIQYASIESGIKAHAEDYSFNIESELFNQLTKEQQALWRKEIEQACISGGYSGLNLAKDPRYKENLEVMEVDIEKELQRFNKEITDDNGFFNTLDIAKHFFELALSLKNN